MASIKQAEQKEKIRKVYLRMRKKDVETMF